MAEAIAAASSVIAIIQITDRIVGLCKFYIETVKDVASDLRLILVEVSALKTIFESLDFLMTHKCGVSSAVSTLSGKGGAIEGCSRSITELEKLFPSNWKQTAGQNTPKKQRVKATWAALAWPLKENKARKLLDEIMRYKTTITLAITADSVQDIKDIRTKSLEMHQILSENQCQEVYKWLQHTDPSPLHHLAQKLYEPGTGNWMLRSPEWTTWLQANQRCLWIHGIPGAGKTVLMSYLITQVQQHCDKLQGGRFTCVYYYCYYGHGQDETVPFLRWLVNRLCREANVVPYSVYKMYKYGGEPSLVELLNALEEVSQKFEFVYIIVDAIDESNPREDLLKVFRDFATDLRFAKIQLLASSREYIDIERVMEDFSVSLSMANDFVQDDIRIHVRHKINSNPKFARWPQDLLYDVEEAVSIGARGMFRWAVCQLDVIQRLKGERHIVQKALKDVPETLDETYDRLLLTLPEEDHQFVRHTLQLILYHSNLYGGYIDGRIPCAVLIKGVERSLAGLNSNQNDRFYDHETLRELCGCLINVTQEEHSELNKVLAGTYPEMLARPQQKVLTVSFAHYTVHEYLKSNRISKNSTEYVISCKEDLKQTFMEVMFSESLQVDSVLDAVGFYFRTYCVVSALYSLRRWPARISRHDTLSKLVIVLLDASKAHFPLLVLAARRVEELTSTSSCRRGQFWDVIWDSEPSSADAAQLMNLLLLAPISLDYLSVASKFLRGKNDKDFLKSRLIFRKRGELYSDVYNLFDDVYSFDGSIIEVFAQLAFETSGIFRLLLEHGMGLFDPSAILLLFVGCHQRHPNHDCKKSCLVERLLQLGADPNMNGYWVSPLQIAVSRNDLEAVTILLKAGAHANLIKTGDAIPWNQDTRMCRFNGLYGASPLSIHRGHLGPATGALSARQGDSEQIETILLQYGAEEYLMA